MKSKNEMTEEDLKRIEDAFEKKSNPTQDDRYFLERARRAVKKK